jgi:hypothetical protein
MPTCTISALTNNDCFQFPCIGGKRQKMVMAYLNAKELAAVGGTNYLANKSTLLIASAGLQSLSGERLNAALLGINRANAIAAGASIPSNVNAIVTAASFFQGIPEDTLDRMLVVLACQLGRHTGT